MSETRDTLARLSQELREVKAAGNARSEGSGTDDRIDEMTAAGHKRDESLETGARGKAARAAAGRNGSGAAPLKLDFE